MATGSSSSTTLPTGMASGTNLLTFTPTHFKLHVVIFPYMAQGHTIPLLDLAKCLTRRYVKVTIITTPANEPFITSHTSDFPAISTVVIPFPEVPYLPKGCENTSALPSAEYILPFINATKLLKQPFEDVLRRLKESMNPPVCVISDYFLGWTVESCRLFGLPRIVSHGMGVLPMLIVKGINQLVRERHQKTSPPVSPNEVIDLTLAGIRVPFELYKGHFPEPLWEADLQRNEFLRIALELDEADRNSWGVIVNSFEELESVYIPALDAIFVEENSRAWCVGPLLLGNNVNDEVEQAKKLHLKDPCIKWLEKRDVDDDSAGVIYVSFGSQAHLPDDQMTEIAYGLLMAGEPFIWVVKSDTWTAPPRWEEQVGAFGFVTREWVNQRKILEHPVVGGFLTHCGWNSVLEGLTAGVPLLAWPMGAEQPINAMYIAMDLHIGLKMPRCSSETKTIDRRTICAAVKELMRGDEGSNARKNAQKYGKLAKEAMVDGGSSHANLNHLVDSLSLRSSIGII